MEVLRQYYPLDIGDVKSGSRISSSLAVISWSDGCTNQLKYDYYLTPEPEGETGLKSLGLDSSYNLTSPAHWGFFSWQNR